MPLPCLDTSIPAFLASQTEERPGASTSTDALHLAYLAWAEQPVGETAFSLAVARARPAWTTTLDGLETRSWRDVALKGDA